MAISEEAGPLDPLTDRELEILNLLAEGLSNGEIAGRLFLTLETIKWYNRQLYSKLGVRSRTQAVARATVLNLLGEGAEAQTPTVETTSHNLPGQLTSFVGREREIGEIIELLGRARLVTLTGAGGCGKTRLGQQVAFVVARQFRDGVKYVPLGSVSSTEEAARAIAHAVGIAERPNFALEEQLKTFFRNKEMLLFLDNFEHLMTAVPLVSNLLGEAPLLKVLITSREPLHLTGEHEYLIPPLSLPPPEADPDPARLLASEAVRLFVERARAIVTHFQLTAESGQAVTEICWRLDGLPLAIELAAARIKLFSPQQMSARLENRLGLLAAGPRDLPARQSTLSSTIDWSYNLLDEAEKILFARLSVFREGCTLEAVEAICGPELEADSLACLESLVNKSLIFQKAGAAGAVRFFMLETIHEYARERLAGRGEEGDVFGRHLEYFLRLVTAVEPELRRRNQMRLLAQIETEMANLFTAFDWAMVSGQVDKAAMLVSVVDYFFRYKDRTEEGYRWTQAVLEKLEGVSAKRRGRLFLAAARIAWQSGKAEQSKALARQGLAAVRLVGDRHNEAWLMLELAMPIFADPRQAKRTEKSVDMIQEAIKIMSEVGDEAGLAYAYNVMGEVWRAAEDFGRARQSYEQSLHYCRETGEIMRECLLVSDLAFIAYRQGSYAEAKELAHTYLRTLHQFDLRLWFLIGLAGLAGPLAKLGEREKAVRLLAASTTLLGTMGLPYPPSDVQEIALYLTDIRREMAEETFAAAWAEGERLTLQEAVGYAVGEAHS